MKMESVQMTKKNWYNIIVLGAGFLLLFSAFQTTAFVQVRVGGWEKRVSRGGCPFVHIMYTYAYR